MAHLTIESVPAGASVKGPGGEVLGHTPLIVDWPTSDVPVRFDLRLSGYRPRQKQTVINGNTRLVIELERVPVVRRPSPNPGPSNRKGSGKGSGKSNGPGNGLMRPDD